MKRIIINIDSSINNDELIDYINRQLNLNINSISITDFECYYSTVIRKVYKEECI